MNGPLLRYRKSRTGKCCWRASKTRNRISVIGAVDGGVHRRRRRQFPDIYISVHPHRTWRSRPPTYRGPRRLTWATNALDGMTMTSASDSPTVLLLSRQSYVIDVIIMSEPDARLDSRCLFLDRYNSRHCRIIVVTAIAWKQFRALSSRAQK